MPTKLEGIGIGMTNMARAQCMYVGGGGRREWEWQSARALCIYGQATKKELFAASLRPLHVSESKYQVRIHISIHNVRGRRIFMFKEELGIR